MSLNKLNREPSDRELRAFGLVQFVVALMLVYATELSAILAMPLVVVTAITAVVGYYFPARLKWNFVGFSLLTYPLGWLVSHAIMFTLFFFIFFPIAVILRVFHRTPLKIEPRPQLDSYWKKSDLTTDKRSYIKQY